MGTHQMTRTRSTTSATARGYGVDHQRRRARWKPRVERGGVPCGWCGRLIDAGEPWHMGHPGDRKDLEPTPWHRKCNLRYALLRRRGAVGRSEAARWWSRSW